MTDLVLWLAARDERALLAACCTAFGFVMGYLMTWDGEKE